MGKKIIKTQNTENIKKEQSHEGQSYQQDKNTKIKNINKQNKEGKKNAFKCGSNSWKCQVHVFNSFSAFGYHCRTHHNGIVPQKSTLNRQIYIGGNTRGRKPKKGKTQDQIEEIEKAKYNQQLMNFLSTIKNPQIQKLVFRVNNSKQHLKNVLKHTLAHWEVKNIEWFRKISMINQTLMQCEVPLDDLILNTIDTYNFVSIIDFLSNQDNRIKCQIHEVDKNVQKVLLIIWLSRFIPTVAYMSQIIFILDQDISEVKPIVQGQYFKGKSKKFLELVTRFLNSHCKTDLKKINL